MKMQLISTLTQQKVWMLFFLTFLHFKQIDSGNAFRNCLIARNDTTSYDVLLKYSFSTNNAIINGNMLSLCCDNSKCIISKTWPCPSNQYSFTCRTFFKNVVCESVDLCRGIIGEQAITKNESFYESACPINSTNRDQFALAGHLISNDLSHIQGLAQGYAVYNCFSDYCLQGYCDWDNGGWLCCNLGSVTDICYMQWPASWPGPANKNPFTAIPTITTIPSRTGTTTVTTTSVATSTLPTSTVTPAPTNNLIEKITIPIGTITGTGLVSGLIYYYCKKKRRNQLKSIDNNLQLEAQGSSHSNSNDLSHIPFEQKIEFTDSQQTNQRSIVDANYQPQLTIITPPISPVPSLTSNSRTQLINHLKQKLVGHEQLWSDYLEINSLLAQNPSSRIINNNLFQIQNQLLQILTIGEIELLKQTYLQITPHFSVPQNEYFGITEEEARNPQSQYFETGNPQEILNYNYQFEVREPQGILDYHY